MRFPIITVGDISIEERLFVYTAQELGMIVVAMCRDVTVVWLCRFSVASVLLLDWLFVVYSCISV